MTGNTFNYLKFVKLNIDFSFFNFSSVSCTFFTTMMPKRLVGSVLMSKVSLPSPSMMVYFISALTPMSLSFAQIRPTTEPTGADSGTLIWYSPEENKSAGWSSLSCLPRLSYLSSSPRGSQTPSHHFHGCSLFPSNPHLIQFSTNGSITASRSGYILSRGWASISSSV